MDRINQLRRKSENPSSVSPPDTSLLADSYLTANESTTSKYFSFSDDVDSTFETPLKDVSVSSDASLTPCTEQPISKPTPVSKKCDDDFKLGKHIEAVSILSGGVEIFEDTENSYDGNELIIDDNAIIDGQDDLTLNIGNSNVVNDVSSNDESKLLDSTDQKTLVEDDTIPSNDTEVILQIDGKNVNAIDIGNGIFLYRREDDELTAVQILDRDQHNFKFLKVRENAEGNLEVYEEIVEEHKEIFDKLEKKGVSENKSTYLPIKDINKVISDHCGSGKLNENKDKTIIEKHVADNRSSSINNKSGNLKTSGTQKEISKKPPVIGSFTAMAYSKPNKDGVPLTKSMVDLQFHSGKHKDIPKKTIEVSTDNSKQKVSDLPVKSISTGDTGDKITEKDEIQHNTALEVATVQTELECKVVTDKVTESMYINEDNSNTTLISSAKRGTEISEKPVNEKSNDERKINESEVKKSISSSDNKTVETKLEIIANDDVKLNSADKTEHKQIAEPEAANCIMENSIVNVDNEVSNDNIVESKKIEIADTHETIKSKNDKNSLDKNNSFADNKFVNKYISEAFGVKNIGAMESFKSDYTSKLVPVFSSDTSPVKELPDTKKAVPFGKWTEANKQEYLNKIKETKVPPHISNTNMIKQTNDLNRREFFKKVDTKPAPTLTNKERLSSKLSEDVKKPISECTKVLPLQRTEINNQHLIDRTIEGILMDKSSATKFANEFHINQTSNLHKYKEGKANDMLLNKQKVEKIEIPTNKIGIKRNVANQKSLVGHKKIDLSQGTKSNVKYFNLKTHRRDPKQSSIHKGSKIPNLLRGKTQTDNKTVRKESTVLDDDHSEDEILECEPVTGDTNIKCQELVPQRINKHRDKCPSTDTHSEIKKLDSVKVSQELKKATPIITEGEFDKFVRRNSKTYENCITVKFVSDNKHNVVQTVIEKDKLSTPNNEQLPCMVENIPQESNETFPSKLQLAYQSALTAKRHKDSPITVIEDKPVKVVFMESNEEVCPYQLNVRGLQLSSKKSQNDSLEFNDSLTLSSCDSLLSDILDSTDEQKNYDNKKSKHQRKQVLTPVDAPEIELIEPEDLGIVISPRRKRKTDDCGKQSQQNSDNITHSKSPKAIVPRKSYLLGRSTVTHENNKHTIGNERNAIERSNHEARNENEINLVSDLEKSTFQRTDEKMRTNSVSNSIDNLVKAAQLLDGVLPPDQLPITTASEIKETSQPQPIKRGRGRPRKYPVENLQSNEISSPPKKTKIDLESTKSAFNIDIDEEILMQNWTMGKINEKIVCPICSKLFRSEDVLFKHVKHCTTEVSLNEDTSHCDSTIEDSIEVKNKVEGNNAEVENDCPGDDKPLKEYKKYLNSEKSETGDVLLTDQSLPDSENPTNKDKVTEANNTKVPKIQNRAHNLICEFCGKTFRQLSNLVNHKSESHKTISSNSVYSCEVCKKDFRMLHHLVQHRVIHSLSSKMSRKNSCEQSEKPTSDTSKPVHDQSTPGFRCEPCDKSFRKLYHLVEHRETHDGINRLKNTSTTNTDLTPVISLQCDNCKKLFRKLHHLIEHREQHRDCGKVERIDDKNSKSALVTKELIHECSLCYMVFPNEHSLNKHFVKCLRKKEKAKLASKQPSLVNETTTDLEENSVQSDINQDITFISVKNRKDSEETADLQNQVHKKENDVQDKDKTETKPPMPPAKRISKYRTSDNELSKLKRTERKMSQKSYTSNKKVDKIAPTVTKRAKNENLNTLETDSSDDENIRYMINPDYSIDSIDKDFYKVAISKRCSLPFNGSKRKSLIPNKLLQLKTEKVNPPRNTVKVANNVNQQRIVKTTEKDDRKIKYSFPKNSHIVKEIDKKNTSSIPKIVKKLEKNCVEKKEMSQKRKSLTGIAKRKSTGKPILKLEKGSPKKIIKRLTEAGHRCDCGQLFSSAALLARHTTNDHTPPRIRRRRSPVAAASSSTATTSTVGSHLVPSRRLSRKSTPHQGVPLPKSAKKVKL